MAVGGERGLGKQCQNDGYNPARRHLVEIRYSDFSLLLSLVISISIHVTLTNRAKPENNGYFIYLHNGPKLNRQAVLVII